ncbi:MAG: polysaccharide biosynthesis tyrosine autokinase [Opitutales bacterium]|nr:polysaccharide biosynthesis tyrosine autokinase [Opitutales bacterium]
MNKTPPPGNDGSYGGGYYGGYYYGEGYGSYAEAAVQPSRGLKDYLVILRERIWWLVVTVFVVFLGVALYTFNAPEQYRAVATVELLRDKDRTVQFEDIVNQKIHNVEDFNTQVQVLESFSMVREVRKRLQGNELRRFMAPYEEGLDVSLRGMRSPEEILFRNRSISPRRLSLMVNIGYSHPNPEVAAAVANYFAEAYLEHSLREQIDGSRRAVDQLRQQADQELVKIKDMERRLADFKDKYGTTSFDAHQDIDNQQLIALNTRLQEDRRNYDMARTAWLQIERAMDEGRPLYELKTIAGTAQVPELLTRMRTLRIDVATLSKRFRDKHPRMIAAREALERTQDELSAAVNEAARSFRNDYERSRTNFENSRERLAEKEREVIELDRLRPEYNALLRDLGISKQLYDHYYSRLQQATVKGSLEGQTARIVDEALVPARPYSPNISLNLAIGLVAGFGLGLGLVFALAILDDKIKTAFDIESTIGLPLIGIVPRISRVDVTEKARIVADNQDKHTVESFRAIVSTLKLNEESRNAKVILTTSTVPSEGKSFVSTNLAITFANHGERTIIVDSDLRMPNIAKSLDLESKVGSLHVLTGDKKLEDVIIKDYLPNLDILPSGGRSKSPTQMLSSERFANLIHELRLRYDKVIIDSPPLAPVSDALNVLPLVDGVLYVVRFNMVKRKTANLNIRRLRESNIPVFGAVLNNINTRFAGYYYSHYYDKSYSQYYFAGDDAEPIVAGGDEGQENIKEETSVKS